MNCCTEYGECRQGRDCPARTGVVLPHQAAHAMRKAGYECAPEAGNVWLAEPEPVELTTWESIIIYTGITLGSIASLAIIAGATDWIYHKFIGA